MFDFRYHTIALVSVFLALAVGLVMGVAIGDRGLVSNAAGKLRENLQTEVKAARQESRNIASNLERARRYEALTLPNLLNNRLEGKHVAVVFIDGTSQGVLDHIRSGVTAAGGKLSSVSTLRLPLDLNAVNQSHKVKEYKGLSTDQSVIYPFARRIGNEITDGGTLLKDVRSSLFESSSGKLNGADAVVVVRRPEKEAIDSTTKQQGTIFVRALLKGMGVHLTPVVGVESSDDDVSQIGWFRDHKMSSVDNVDEPAGKASLALMLNGDAVGSYGMKGSARDGLLPDALTRTAN